MNRRLYYTAPSHIHGIGLFAAKTFAKGALIGVFQGVPTELDGNHVLWIEEQDGTFTGVECRNELRYANHSSRPNAELDGAALYAIKLIRNHEEITLHYGTDWEDIP